MSSNWAPVFANAYVIIVAQANYLQAVFLNNPKRLCDPSTSAARLDFAHPILLQAISDAVQI